MIKPYQSSLVSFRIPIWHFYAKYCNSAGGSTSKKLEVVFPYKHVRMFLKRTLTTWCLPTAFIPSLRFFSIIYEFTAFDYIAKKPLYGYPNFTHSFIKCPHMWGQWVVTIETHQMWSERIGRISINAERIPPVGVTALLCKILSSPASLSIPALWRRPLTGSYKLATKPLGITTALKLQGVPAFVTIIHHTLVITILKYDVQLRPQNQLNFSEDSLSLI